jgi:hypothetical protein
MTVEVHPQTEDQFDGGHLNPRIGVAQGFATKKQRLGKGIAQGFPTGTGVGVSPLVGVVVGEAFDGFGGKP